MANKKIIIILRKRKFNGNQYINFNMEIRKRILKPDSNINDVIDCGVSIDGTWQRRDYFL